MIVKGEFFCSSFLSWCQFCQCHPTQHNVLWFARCCRNNWLEILICLALSQIFFICSDQVWNPSCWLQEYQGSPIPDEGFRKQFASVNLSNLWEIIHSYLGVKMHNKQIHSKSKSKLLADTYKTVSSCRLSLTDSTIHTCLQVDPRASKGICCSNWKLPLLQLLKLNWKNKITVLQIQTWCRCFRTLSAKVQILLMVLTDSYHLPSQGFFSLL